MTAVHKPQDFDATLPADPGIFAELQAKEELKRQRELEEKRLDNALASVLDTDSGRKVLNWILGLTGIDDSCTSMDAMQMMALSARRDVGLQIKGRLRAAGLICNLEEEQ